MILAEERIVLIFEEVKDPENQICVYDGVKLNEKMKINSNRIKSGEKFYSRGSGLTISCLSMDEGIALDELTSEMKDDFIRMLHDLNTIRNCEFAAAVKSAPKGQTCTYRDQVIDLVGGKGHETLILETANFGGRGKYLPHMDCVWLIRGPIRTHIELTFLSPIDIAPKNGTLIITQGMRKRRTELARFAGIVEEPKVPPSTCHFVTVEMKSMFFDRRSGFCARADIVPGGVESDDDC